MAQPSMDEANERMSEADRARFTLACNRPVCDEHWADGSDEWVGKASMSEFHRFMLIDNLDWRGFNVLTIGMGGVANLEVAISTLRDMMRLSREYASAEGRKGPIELCFHVYPSNTVQALHMHIVDTSTAGPTYDALSYKNMKAEDVLQVRDDGPTRALALALTRALALALALHGNMPRPNPHPHRCRCSRTSCGARRRKGKSDEEARLASWPSRRRGLPARPQPTGGPEAQRAVRSVRHRYFNPHICCSLIRCAWGNS